MREIKFRAWDGEQMVSPDYIDRKGIAHWKADSIPVKTSLVMQYTGLKDKNGKEIYERDILKDNLGNIHEACWGIARYATNLIKRKSEHYPARFLDCEYMEWEIIGNVYEGAK